DVAAPALARDPAGDRRPPPGARVPPAAEGQPGAAAAGRHPAGARGTRVRGPDDRGRRAEGTGRVAGRPPPGRPGRRLTPAGPRVAAFEEAFARYVGAPHASAVSSCTAALHLALYALGVGPGDEFVTVSHSFVATANAVAYCGATPVFVDVDPRTYNIDPALI